MYTLKNRFSIDSDKCVSVSKKNSFFCRVYRQRKTKKNVKPMQNFIVVILVVAVVCVAVYVQLDVTMRGRNFFIYINTSTFSNEGIIIKIYFFFLILIV